MRDGSVLCTAFGSRLNMPSALARSAWSRAKSAPPRRLILMGSADGAGVYDVGADALDRLDPNGVYHPVVQPNTHRLGPTAPRRGKRRRPGAPAEIEYPLWPAVRPTRRTAPVPARSQNPSAGSRTCDMYPAVRRSDWPKPSGFSLSTHDCGRRQIWGAFPIRGLGLSPYRRRIDYRTRTERRSTWLETHVTVHRAARVSVAESVFRCKNASAALTEIRSWKRCTTRTGTWIWPTAAWRTGWPRPTGLGSGTWPGRAGAAGLRRLRAGGPGCTCLRLGTGPRRSVARRSRLEGARSQATADAGRSLTTAYGMVWA